MVFGDGAKTYPAGGVPLPEIESFGLTNHIDTLQVEVPALGYDVRYDKTNHKLRIYEQGLRTGSTSAADSTSGALVEGGVNGTTATALRGMGTAVDTTYQLGPAKELVATSTPPEITLTGLAIGY